MNFLMSFVLKKVDVHKTSKWTLYEVQPVKTSDLLNTSSDTDENYKRLNATKVESRKKANVKLKDRVDPITEKTISDLSF